jgi:hypothetical protein
MLSNRPDKLSGTRKIAHTAVDYASQQPSVQSSAPPGYRQLGSQISRFHVDCEIGKPVRIGYIHAKFVITKAT